MGRGVLAERKSLRKRAAARAYDRGERFTQRVQLFNWWGEQFAAA